MAHQMPTEQQSPPQDGAPESKRDVRRQAKSDLAAAKARAKAERPFYKKPWVWIVGIIAVIVLAQAGGGGDSADVAGGGESVQSDTQKQTAGIGDPVSDGQFTFTVHEFNCGETRVGKGFLAEEAQGQFCIAQMTVENTGDQGTTLDAGSQYAFIDTKKYEAEPGIGTETAQGKSFFLENINPGNSVDGIVVWDVPKGQKPNRLELHDSLFSGGVEIEV